MTEFAGAGATRAAAVDLNTAISDDPAPNNQFSAQVLALEAMMERHWAEERCFLRQLRGTEDFNPAVKRILSLSEPLRLPAAPEFFPMEKPLQLLPSRFRGSKSESSSQPATPASDEDMVMGTDDAKDATDMLEQDVLCCAKTWAEDLGRASVQDQDPLASMTLRSVRTMESLKMSWMHDDDLVVGANWVKRLVSRQWYETLSCMIVASNAIFVGLQTQAAAEHALEIARAESADEFPLHDMFPVIQGLFTAVFALDLALRWTAGGLVHFWRQKEVGWNLLDSIVVVTGVIDIAIEFSVDVLHASPGSDSAMGSFSLFRLLRLLRVVRVARIIRVARFFRDLRLMIASILYSGKSLVWALVVVLLLLYMASIIFTGAVSAQITGEEKPKDVDSSLIFFFGTLDVAIVSLLMTMTGGADWEQFYRAIQTLGQPFEWLFVLFILISQFAVLNLVTGVFMSNTLNACARDAKLLVQEEMEGMRDNYTILQALFDAMDRDGSGILNKQIFQERVQDPEVSALFKSIHLQASDANLLFDLLDRNKASEVSVREFISGCYALMGEATSFDAKVLRIEVSCLLRAVQEIETLLKGESSQRKISETPKRHMYRCSL